MTNQDNNDLEKIQNKLDLKQFSDYQIAISKQTLQDQYEKNRRDLERYKIKFLVSILSLVGVTGIVSFITLTKTINDLRAKVTDRLDVEVSRIDTTIHNRLDYEFSTPKITKLIENKAQEYTEKNAKNYIETQVTSKIEPFIAKINTSLIKSDNLLKGTNDAIIKANRQLDDLTFYNNILNLQAEALSGSRNAYNKLYKIYWSNTINKVFVEYAIQSIDRYYENIYENIIAYPGLESKSSDAKIPTKELFDNLNQNSTRLSLKLKLVIIGKILNCPDNEIYESAYDILKASESLEACAITTSILRNKYGTKATFMDFDGWLKVINEELKK